MKDGGIHTCGRVCVCVCLHVCVRMRFVCVRVCVCVSMWFVCAFCSFSACVCVRIWCVCAFVLYVCVCGLSVCLCECVCECVCMCLCVVSCAACNYSHWDPPHPPLLCVLPRDICLAARQHKPAYSNLTPNQRRRRFSPRSSASEVFNIPRFLP